LENVMCLPACQQRVLDGMEAVLQAREPRLASMFAIFTRLAGDEATPRWEGLNARSSWAQRWLGWLASRLRRPARPASSAASAPRWATGRPRGQARAVVLIPLTVICMLGAILLCVDLAGLPAGGRPPAACGTALTLRSARTCFHAPR
jgi:hypothetical protein